MGIQLKNKIVKKKFMKKPGFHESVNQFEPFSRKCLLVQGRNTEKKYRHHGHKKVGDSEVGQK